MACSQVGPQKFKALCVHWICHEDGLQAVSFAAEDGVWKSNAADVAPPSYGGGAGVPAERLCVVLEGPYDQLNVPMMIHYAMDLVVPKQFLVGTVVNGCSSGW